VIRSRVARVPERMRRAPPHMPRRPLPCLPSDSSDEAAMDIASQAPSATKRSRETLPRPSDPGAHAAHEAWGSEPFHEIFCFPGWLYSFPTSATTPNIFADLRLVSPPSTSPHHPQARDYGGCVPPRSPPLSQPHAGQAKAAHSPFRATPHTLLGAPHPEDRPHSLPVNPIENPKTPSWI
jgi:hypothetical protein